MPSLSFKIIRINPDLEPSIYDLIPALKRNLTANNLNVIAIGSGEPRGGVGVFNPPSEIPKALQNRAKINPIVKTVKNCWI